MTARDLNHIVDRLVANPHDEEALRLAYDISEDDTKGYVELLDRVAEQTLDPTVACYWFTEAATVYLDFLDDAPRAAHLFMAAMDKDPTQRIAPDRLSKLYRDRGDTKSLAGLLERRLRSLQPLLASDRTLVPEFASMHEELGMLWTQPPLAQPKKALEHFRKAMEFDPNSAFAIYQTRELLKAQGEWPEVFVLFEKELALEKDPARSVAILRDEARCRKAVSELVGATRSLARALELDPSNPVLLQEFSGSILERLQAGDAIDPSERRTAVDYLLQLAEQFPGEHALAYSAGALDLDPGDDYAFSAFIRAAEAVGDRDSILIRARGYQKSNPAGVHGEIARTYAPPSIRLEALARAPRDEASVPTAARADTRTPRAVQVPTPEGDFSVAGPLLESERLQRLLELAQASAQAGDTATAIAKYKELLATDPLHAEALTYVEQQLRAAREYAQLRDVILASIRAIPAVPETLEKRKDRLREVAGVCETGLHDVDSAITTWRQILSLDKGDELAQSAVEKLLERSQRWDDLASHLDDQASSTTDLDAKIALEKKLASVHELKRRDFIPAAESWARIARLVPEDDDAILTAARLFEKSGSLDRAATVLDDHVACVEDPSARGAILETLGRLRETLGDPTAAAQAFSSAADLLQTSPLWESAERCFTAAQLWTRAADAASHRSHIAEDPKEKAGHFARAAGLHDRAGDETGALALLEQASELDPGQETYAELVVSRLRLHAHYTRLAEYLAARASRLQERTIRVAVRREAAQIAQAHLSDRTVARDLWQRLLEDGEDREALERLIENAIERDDPAEAAKLLERLGAIAIDNADKARVALREAELFSDALGDVDRAIARYEQILSELDPTSRPALQAIADLEETRDNLQAAATALERELKLVQDASERGQIGKRLAGIYERTGDIPAAVRSFDIVRSCDPDDYDALARLTALCEKSEQWDRVANLLAERVETEGDEVECIALARKLATILADRLHRGEEALAALAGFADRGDPETRQYYIELGDRLGSQGRVAERIVAWWIEARPSANRTEALRGAFDRFAAVGRDGDAIRVGMEIVRARGGDRRLAEELEGLAMRAGNTEALILAHDLLVRDLIGLERAEECVRQAAVRASAGVRREDAILFGESGLVGLTPAEVEPLLFRLAELAERPDEIVDLYERQVARYRTSQDRTEALAKAAEVASGHDDIERARGFFELALIGIPSPETLELLERVAAHGDVRLQRALAAAFAAGGGGARDGGRTRSALLCRAAEIARRDIRDLDLAFRYLGDALVAHVDSAGLAALDHLSETSQDYRRGEEALSRALAEVFDGTFVRQLLAARASLRRTHLDDKAGAASDLRRLHEVSSGDPAILVDLAALLSDLGDFRGLVQLYEDEILRGKDVPFRAELARRVGRLWEEKLGDAREAADAWRRVLRMAPKDPEAEQGLDRAKRINLRPHDGDPERYAPPPPPPAQPRRTSAFPSAPPGFSSDSPVDSDFSAARRHRQDSTSRTADPVSQELIATILASGTPEPPVARRPASESPSPVRTGTSTRPPALPLGDLRPLEDIGKDEMLDELEVLEEIDLTAAGGAPIEAESAVDLDEADDVELTDQRPFVDFAPSSLTEDTPRSTSIPPPLPPDKPLDKTRS